MANKKKYASELNTNTEEEATHIFFPRKPPTKMEAKRKIPGKVFADLDALIRKMRPVGNSDYYTLMHEASSGNMSEMGGCGLKKMVQPFLHMWMDNIEKIVDNQKLSATFKTLSDWTEKQEKERYLVEVLLLMQMSWESYSGVTSDRYPTANQRVCSREDRESVLGVLR